METITRAVIIAAGEGKRLRPLTEKIPKPLVLVNGVRIVDTSIRALKANNIHEIYLVAGYKKEQFYELYGKDPDIRILENPWYAQGNNITSLYAAKDHLENAFIIEGDLLVRDQQIFRPETEGSCYLGVYMEQVPEWAMKLRDGRIVSCDIKGGENAFRNLGISLWTKKDGKVLGELAARAFENKMWNIYWDEIPLFYHPDRFRLGIRETGPDALTEIDTVKELKALDPGYEKYL